MKAFLTVLLVVVAMLMVVTTGEAVANFKAGRWDLFCINLICLGVQAVVGGVHIFVLDVVLTR